jgi:ApaG protein
VSSATTDGIRISVSSEYVPQQSRPQQKRYFFAYTVTIENVGQKTTQLESRHWVITDATGKVEEVRGPGVVGQQPVLRPGQRFEYTSGCILETPRGSMHGSYQMRDDGGRRFDAAIARFELALPYSLN